MTTPENQPTSITKKATFRVFIFLLLLAVVSFSYSYLNKTFFNERQTNILADVTRLVSKTSEADYIFLTNPPKTSQGLIDWWIEHRQLLTDDYGIPNKEKCPFLSGMPRRSLEKRMNMISSVPPPILLRSHYEQRELPGFRLPDHAHLNHA